MTKKSIFRFLPLALICLVIIGCARPQQPSASDTVLGPPTAARGDGSDIITGDGVYTDADWAAGDGLTGRGDAFNDPTAVGAGSRANAMTSIFFGFDESGIRPAERAKIESVVATMREQPNLRVVCVGHTDWIGTEEYNIGLGDRRANSVKSYMVQLGVSANRIATNSMGKMEATPDVHRDSPQARDDRRVDIVPSR